MRNSKSKTSWQPVEKWYNESVGKEGHYYHQNIVLPGVLRLFHLKEYDSPSVLDLACGQGVLARQLPKEVPYVGVDIAPSFIKYAREYDNNELHEFFVGDITKDIPIKKKEFTHAAIILALQNVEHPLNALKNARKFMKQGGTLVIVLNHPCFRIPRQSSWKVDQENKIQYRRLDRYLSPMKIPIQANPSKGKDSPATMSYHFPLSSYTQWLNEAGFSISLMEEWCSDKSSTGKAAKMEDRAREEFPLFLTIVACKVDETQRYKGTKNKKKRKKIAIVLP